MLAGRYKVLDEIGRGGMGVVYRVEHVHTGEPLALKVLVGAARSDPQAIKRFKREARTSARIKSEHVVHVSDADTSPELDGSPFFVMAFLSGMDVGGYAAQRGPLEPSELVAVLAQVGSVLETAHALGIVHRDLKPENLFLHRRKDGTTTTKGPRLRDLEVRIRGPGPRDGHDRHWPRARDAALHGPGAGPWAQRQDRADHGPLGDRAHRAA